MMRLPVVSVPHLCCSVSKSTRPSWNKFLADVGVTPRKRWITIFAKEVICIWRSMSARVVPYRQLQPEQLFISATRAQLRVLKNYGIVARQEVSLYERAANKAQQLCDRIDGKSTCMWLDNVYIKHFVLNLFYSDRSHNATATCLLCSIKLNNCEKCVWQYQLWHLKSKSLFKH